MIMSSFKRAAISNRHICKRPLTEQIKLIGVTIDCLILREKDLSEQAYETLAREVQKTCRDQGIELICHTFVRAARKIGCSSIHLTYSDFLKQRNQLQGFTCVGVSAHSMEEVKAAEQAGASYVTISPVFPTACKEGVAAKGLDFLEEICRKYSIKVYALGGITDANELDVKQAGAAGACRMSDYMLRNPQ